MIDPETGVDAHITVPASRMAQFVGLSERDFNRLVQAGVFAPVNPEAKRNRLYYVDDTIRAYIRHLEEEYGDPKDRTLEALELEKLKAEADYKAAKAEEERLRLEALESTMHPAWLVRITTDDMIQTLTVMLLALPERVAEKAYLSSSAAECADVIEKDVYEILRIMADFQICDAEHTERVIQYVLNGRTEEELDDELREALAKFHKIRESYNHVESGAEYDAYMAA